MRNRRRELERERAGRLSTEGEKTREMNKNGGTKRRRWSPLDGGISEKLHLNPYGL